MRKQTTVRVSLTSLLIFAFAVSLTAQGLEYVKANYTKQEYTITMRDGVRLFTSVYVPKDSSHTYPILLDRTPYSCSPYGADRCRENIGPSPLFPKEGYIIVFQDVRGRWMSEGKFEHMRPHKDVKSGPKDTDESTDAYDTIDWLAKNIPGNNGRAGMWGISYDGFYAAAGAIDAHPALKAVSPQAPVSDWFSSDDWHHNGAFLLAHAFGWFSGAGWEFTRPATEAPGRRLNVNISDGYDFYKRLGPLGNVNENYLKGEIGFWNEMTRRDTKDDWWKAHNLRPHLKKITPAVMTVGGWFDAENLFGALGVYRSIEENSPGAFNVLVMGPWVHGGWARSDGDSLGDVQFDAKTAEYFREHMELPFFNYFLKDKGRNELPEACVFETGTNRWHKFDVWPPKNLIAQSLFLRADGKLSFEPPEEEGANTFDEYISDPAKPVPFMPTIVSGMAQRYMVEDQRFAARRTDVLVYAGDELSGDITIAGPVVPSLQVSTTGTDSDWIVKLIDVYPDRFPDEKGNINNTLGSYQQMVRGDVIRGKFRNSPEKPEPFEPGKPAKVEFTASDIFHTFRRGHRIMVQIQSTWFPLIDLNPQRFENIFQAKEGDFQKATQRVYRSRSLASQIKIGVLPPSRP